MISSLRVCLLLILTCPIVVQENALFGQVTNWVMVWEDDFSIDGKVDSTKWIHDIGGNGFGNQEAQYYTESINNSYVSDGNLIIKAIKESYQGNEYTSAKLISKNKGDWKYGKFEIRAKLPGGKGMWPAIWMLPTDGVYGGWPKSGEIDIMENVGFENDIIHWNTHTEAFNHTLGTNKGDKATISNVTSEFHVYGIEWYEDNIQFFVDGVKYFQFDKEGETYKEWPFDQEFYMILNIAVGGTWGGLQGIDDNIFPQEMVVDYVKVYELVEEKTEYALSTQTSMGGSISASVADGNVLAGQSVMLTAVAANGYEFVGWEGTFDAVSNPISFNMDLPVTMKAKFSKIGEMLNNASFLDGLSSWDYYDGGFATITGSESGLMINTTSDANNAWDVQVSQSPFSLEKGCNYTLEVISESTVATAYSVGIGLNGTPWTSYASRNVVLSPNVEKTTTANFTVSSDRPNARIFFDLGNASVGEILIKEVSLLNSCLITSNEELIEKAQVVVFPNPTTDFVNFNLSTEWQLYDSMGHLLKNGKGDKVYFTGYTKGIYILKSEGQTFKVVLE